MARDNRLRGAERIQSELRQLGIKLAKRTIQKYMQAAGHSRPYGQTWSTFLRNHAAQIWACDFLPVVDFTFRQLYAFLSSNWAHAAWCIGVSPGIRAMPGWRSNCAKRRPS